MKTRMVNTPDHWLKTAATLSEALPYMRQFAGEIFVIKYGGHAMGDATLLQQFARDVVLLKQVGVHPVVVHGGGPQIGAMLERLKIQSAFIDGLRVTDEATVEIVEMVLSGSINKQIVTAINAEGGIAMGLSGKDGRLIEAQKMHRTTRDPDSNIEKVLDLGYVGEPTFVNPDIVEAFATSDFIPVIAPIGIGEDGKTYNINADTAAGAIASSVAAAKLVLLTDVAGILNTDKQLISSCTPAQARQLITEKIVTGGMIPKVETCLHVLENGVEAAHILDGRVPHVLLIEVFTSYGAGTMLTNVSVDMHGDT